MNSPNSPLIVIVADQGEQGHQNNGRIIEMSYYWLRRPKAFLYAPIIAVLLLAAAACGAAATATPVPTTPPTEAPVVMAEPTAMPEPMEKPADEMMAGARHAPAFRRVLETAHGFLRRACLRRHVFASITRTPWSMPIPGEPPPGPPPGIAAPP